MSKQRTPDNYEIVVKNTPPDGYECAVCGLRIKSGEVWSFVCGQFNCPMFPNITCRGDL